MTLDATALIAIQRRAPGWEALVARVVEHGHARVPATALAEAGMVLVAEGEALNLLALSQLVDTLKLTVVPFTAADWHAAAMEYYERRSAGRRAQARFGDCLTAAVATRTGAEVMAWTEE